MIGGALVTFGDGAGVSKLSLPSDFSAVHLDNLPIGSSAASVTSLILNTAGIRVRKEHVLRIFTHSGRKGCSAVVEVDDPKFSSTLCDKIKGGVAKFKATPISVTMSAGSLTSAKFKISLEIYDAVRDRFDSEKSEWEKGQVQFTAYPPSQGYRVLKVEGENRKTVEQAKETLGRIVGGQIASQDGNDIWHPRLGKRFMWEEERSLIEQDCGVVILPDRRKCQVRVFGSEDGCKRASERLATLFKDLGQAHLNEGWVIELDEEKFSWALRGGFNELVLCFGENTATFDLVSTPKRIIIAGSEHDYTSALAMIAKALPHAEQLDQTEDCSVCWTEAEHPVRTSCNHVYCSTCFLRVLIAEGPWSTAEFCISCVGGEKLCNKILTLAEIQTHLDPAAFESLLVSSFASHVRGRPGTLRYCPTPRCEHIYRPTTMATSTNATSAGGSTFACPNCLIPTCTTCHAPHPSMTCVDYRKQVAGVYKRAKKKLGIKDCPTCKTAIEKSGGCDVVTCQVCRTEFCWQCLADITEHLGNGGFGWEGCRPQQP